MPKRELSIRTVQITADPLPTAKLHLALESDESVVAPDGLIASNAQPINTDADGTATVSLWPSAELMPPTNYIISGPNIPPCTFTMPDADSDLHTLCAQDTVPATDLEPATPVSAAGGTATLLGTRMVDAAHIQQAEYDDHGNRSVNAFPTMVSTLIQLPDDATDDTTYWIQNQTTPWGATTVEAMWSGILRHKDLPVLTLPAGVWTTDSIAPTPGYFQRNFTYARTPSGILLVGGWFSDSTYYDFEVTVWRLPFELPSS